MAFGLPLLPDWRDDRAYAPLAAVEASAIAWEWLRRDPHYQEEAGAAARGGRAGEGAVADPGAARWSLHRFEPADRPAPAARPLWTSDAFAYVLEVQAEASKDAGDRFDPEAMAGLATMIRGGGRDHLLLSDGARSVRLDIEGGLPPGPVRLRYLLSGVAAAERPLLVLRRFLALCRRGRFSRPLHPPLARAARHVLLLRTWDALALGVSQREIASELVSRSAAAPRWRLETPSARLAAQRLVRDARRLGGGAWRRLLQ